MKSTFLFPRPQKVNRQPETFVLPETLGMILPTELERSSEFIEKFFSIPFTAKKADILFEKDTAMQKESYKLEVATKKITVTYADAHGAFYALVTLGQLVRQNQEEIPCCVIEDAPALEVRGFMLDISRGKIPVLKDLCELADRLAALKYNQLQLYIEGFSFAYPSFTKYWQDKTPLTGEEIRFFDQYCKDRFIELVPNQNSLGHMADWLAQDEFCSLAVAEKGIEFFGRQAPVGTLDPQDAGSIELVTKMIDDLLPNFSSEIFNVNLDEPFELGQGKSKAAAEKIGVGKLYTNYLNQLYDVVSARKRKMYMWGDILAKYPEAVEDIPKDVTVLDWGYEDIYPFEERAAALEKCGLPFILCPGTAVWTSLTGRTDNMIGCIRNAGQAAVKHGAKGVILTEWGDQGHTEYEPMNEPALCYAAFWNWSGCDTDENSLMQYMDRFVFEDKAGVMGKLTLELGRYIQFEEFPMMNMTVTRLALMMGVMPSQVWEQSLKMVAGQFAALSNETVAVLLQERYNNKQEFDYAGLCAHMERMRTLLRQSRMDTANADLLKKEYENEIRMVEFAGGLHYFNAKQDSFSEEEKKEFIQKLCKTGEKFLETHPMLWVARNRLHGMQASTEEFRAVLAQLKDLIA